MKLVNFNLENEIDFEISRIWTLVCENPKQFCMLTADLVKQVDGVEGDWRLVDVKSSTFAKSVVYIADYHNISLNDKKANSLLQDKLKSLAFDEAHTVATHEIISALDKYARLLSFDIDVPVSVGEVDFAQICKMIGICCLDDANNVLERLVDYTTLLSRLTATRLIVCVNLRSYLCLDELVKYYEHCMQNDINLLCIENSLRATVLHEKVLLCDEDLCEIFPRNIVEN